MGNRGFASKALQRKKMLAVIAQLFNGLADVIKGQMSFLFFEAVHDGGLPAGGENLQRADIQCPIVEIAL